MQCNGVGCMKTVEPQDARLDRGFVSFFMRCFLFFYIFSFRNAEEGAVFLHAYCAFMG